MCGTVRHSKHAVQGVRDVCVGGRRVRASNEMGCGRSWLAAVWQMRARTACKAARRPNTALTPAHCPRGKADLANSCCCYATRPASPCAPTSPLVTQGSAVVAQLHSPAANRCVARPLRRRLRAAAWPRHQPRPRPAGHKPGQACGAQREAAAARLQLAALHSRKACPEVQSKGGRCAVIAVPGRVWSWYGRVSAVLWPRRAPDMCHAPCGVLCSSPRVPGYAFPS